MKKLMYIAIVLLLAGCNSEDDPSAGNGRCNDASTGGCAGEWVGTECGDQPGRGFTCTDTGGGGILTPNCSCSQ